MSIQIKSILCRISEVVFKSTSLDEAKNAALPFIESSHINDKDKNIMLNEVRCKLTLIQLQKYICNALLKYEGLSMPKTNSKKSQNAKNNDFEGEE